MFHGVQNNNPAETKRDVAEATEASAVDAAPNTLVAEGESEQAQSSIANGAGGVAAGAEAADAVHHIGDDDDVPLASSRGAGFPVDRLVEMGFESTVKLKFEVLPDQLNTPQAARKQR